MVKSNCLVSPILKIPFRQIIFTFLIISWNYSFAQVGKISTRLVNDSIREYIKVAKIPGVSFAELNNFKITETKSIGVINTDSKKPVNENTVFEAASLTKPIVAYCALKMVEKKKLELDKPLFNYYKYTDILHDDRSKSITARMILSHTSGLPNWRSDRKSDTINLKFIPGSRFSYSGEGFVYLQKIMEYLMETDLNTIANQFVFDPLKMSHSSLVFNFKDNFAVGHDPDNKPIKKIKPNLPNAAYSLQTTASDYAKFLIELVNPEFINKKLINAMCSAQNNTLTNDLSMSWGLGIGLNLTKEDKFLWHWGDNKYFKSFFIISTKSGNGFIYFSNSESGLSIVHRVIKLILKDEEIMKHWNDYGQF